MAFELVAGFFSAVLLADLSVELEDDDEESPSELPLEEELAPSAAFSPAARFFLLPDLKSVSYQPPPLQAESGRRNQLGQRHRAALRALFERVFADFLHGFELMFAFLALIFVDRHVV